MSASLLSVIRSAGNLIGNLCRTLRLRVCVGIVLRVRQQVSVLILQLDLKGSSILHTCAVRYVPRNLVRAFINGQCIICSAVIDGPYHNISATGYCRIGCREGRCASALRSDCDGLDIIQLVIFGDVVRDGLRSSRYSVAFLIHGCNCF